MLQCECKSPEIGRIQLKRFESNPERSFQKWTLSAWHCYRLTSYEASPVYWGSPLCYRLACRRLMYFSRVEQIRYRLQTSDCDRDRKQLVFCRFDARHAGSPALCSDDEIIQSYRDKWVPPKLWQNPPSILAQLLQKMISLKHVTH